jgi:hypothetical protein
MKNINPELYKQYFKNAVPYIYIGGAYLLTQCLISCFLIISLLFVIFKEKWSRLGIDLKLMTMIIILDLCGAAIIIVGSVSNLCGSGFIIDTTEKCYATAIWLLFTLLTSVNITGVLSLQRCLFVVFNKKYPDKFYYSIIFAHFIFNIISWITCCINQGFTIMPLAQYCMFDVTTRSGVISSAMLIISCGISDILVFTCYPIICVHCRNESKITQLELGMDPAKVKNKVNTTMAKSLFVILASMLSNVPYCIILITKCVKGKNFAPSVDLVQTLLLSTTVVINSLILINLKPELWKSLKILWRFKV